MDDQIKNCSNPEVEVDTTNCTNTDAYDVSIDIGWFNEWVVWEGGIAFNCIYWSLILILFFALLYLFRQKFKWRLLTERLDGLEDPPPQLKRSGSSSWIDWLTLKIDEEAVGKDGATFLWFQFRLIQVQILMTVLGIVLIVMHHNGDKLGEWPSKTLRSTGLYNIGVNGAHGVICSAILITLAWLMRQHGQDRGVRSLASHDVNSFSTVCNRRWLMISGIPLTTTADSLLEYLMCSLDAKGIHQEQIVMAKDVSKLLPVQNQLNFIRNVKQKLNGRVLMGRRFWDFKSWLKPAIGAVSYYNNKEEALAVKKDEIINQLKFTGTVFIRFDSPAEAKATKFAIRRHQSNWLWKCEESNLNQQFRPSEWAVRYAPPGSDINWMHLKNPRPPVWKTLLVWLRVLAIYSIYIFLMAAPATIVHWLQLDGQEGWIFWKRFALPTLVSLFTTKLTNWVTGQDQHRHHLTLTKSSLASFRSICFLEILLYMIRMMARKPLPLLLAGEFNSDDIRLACVFFPVHGSFLACCIIVNTAGGILMNHLRFDFFWSYVKKWFSFRSEEEKSTYIVSYRIDYDFASNYAELITNFALTSFFIVIFPVISLVSFTFSILRFVSDRSALTRIYPVGRIGHNLHQESINMAMRFAIASPLALLIYRRIQLGPGVKLLDPGIVAPTCLLILYATYLLYAHVKSYGVLPTWFCRLTKLRSRNDISNIEDDDDEDVVDSMSNIQHEYDPLAQIREQELYKFNHSSSVVSTPCKDSVPAQLVVC